MVKPSKIKVRVYFNQDSFAEVALDAVTAQKRHGGLQNYVQVIKGGVVKEVPNTKSISKFLKFCWKYWKDDKPRRQAMEAELDAEEKRLAARRASLKM